MEIKDVYLTIVGTLTRFPLSLITPSKPSSILFPCLLATPIRIILFGSSQIMDCLSLPLPTTTSIPKHQQKKHPPLLKFQQHLECHHSKKKKIKTFIWILRHHKFQLVFFLVKLGLTSAFPAATVITMRKIPYTHPVPQFQTLLVCHHKPALKWEPLWDNQLFQLGKLLEGPLQSKVQCLANLGNAHSLLPLE